MSTSTTSKEWYQDQYMVSTSPALIQVSAINDAFHTPEVYWTEKTDPDSLKETLNNSLCFGLYLLPKSTFEMAGKAQPVQIGLARLVTDRSTIAFLTDVYVLKEYQGKGLGKWLLGCVKETLGEWPSLRRCMLTTVGEGKLYREVLGMQPWDEEGSGSGSAKGMRIWNVMGVGGQI